jgi:hypothetical protein
MTSADNNRINFWDGKKYLAEVNWTENDFYLISRFMWDKGVEQMELEKLEFKDEKENSYSLKIDNNLLDFVIKEIKETARNFQGISLESFFQDSSSKLFSKTSFEIIISRQEVENAINQLIEERNSINIGAMFINVSRKNNVLFFELSAING